MLNEAKTEDVYGIVVSQLGSDALTAADQDLILSGSFPMPKIGKEIVITVTITSANQGLPIELLKHDFGYPCFCMVSQIESNAVYNLFVDVTINSTSIYLTGYSLGTYTYRVTAFRNRLSENIVTPVFLTQSREVAQRNRNYGLLVSKEGKSTDSNDYRDFTFHSGTRNLLIHRVLAGLVDSGTQCLTFKNDLPYRPIYYVFASTDGGANYILLYGGNQSFPGMYQDTNGDVILLGGDSTTIGSIWVFKDPMNPGASENVII